MDPDKLKVWCKDFEMELWENSDLKTCFRNKAGTVAKVLEVSFINWSPSSNPPKKQLRK